MSFSVFPLISKAARAIDLVLAALLVVAFS